MVFTKAMKSFAFAGGCARLAVFSYVVICSLAAGSWITLVLLLFLYATCVKRE
jgi:hypothetical protein